MDNTEHQQKQGFYHFGLFRLDTAERRLWRENETIPLAPKQFDLLLYFVENAGRVAKKSDLLNAVWTDSYVEETTLARNVSWLRKQLESGADEKFIETVPKLGYRFTAKVTRPQINENLIIIEEQIVQHFRGEETITISENPADEKGNAQEERNRENEQSRETEKAKSLLPDVFSSSRFSISLSSLLIITVGLAALVGSGFFVYQNYFKPDSSKGLSASNTVLFTGATGNENSPAFSPDSQMLAYSWNGGEGVESDIYVRIIGAGDPLQLTKTSVNEQYPVFAPDGKYIAFVRGKYGEPGEVFIIPSLGGVERRVARMFSGNYSISFAPDGKHIAVVDTENSSPGGQFAIYLVNIQTGERRRLTAPAEFDGESTPRFSPDGKSLAFIRSTRNVNIPGVGQHDLFIVPVTGGEPHQLTFEGTIIHSLAWSADGDFIYFVPYGPPSHTFVKRIPAAGGKQELLPLVGSEITNIALSPDGKKLVYAENPWLFSILRVFPGGKPAEILNKANVNQGAPQFSPDGSRIVFHSDRTRILQIWAMDADGKNMRQLTDAPFPSTSPQFSPDGSQIAFNRKQGKDSANYIIPAEGGAARRISPPDAADDYPVWSADGKHLYFISRRSGNLNIWKTKADDADGEDVQITKNGAVFAAPAPDEKFIYFKKEGVDKELWRVAAEGGTEELLSEFTEAGFSGSWIMKETGILFFARDADQNYKLKFYDFAARQIKEASGNYNISPNFDAGCMTTDGNIILCSILEKISHLTLADLH